MRKKYIIELEDNILAYTAIIIDGVPYIKPLQLLPYTEPDLDAIRKEACEEGYKEGMQLSIDDAKLKEEYRRGLDDAWEAARTLWNTPNRKEIFGHTTFNTVLTTLTAQEAIEKIRQYEQEKEEIKVGDEVKSIESGWTAIVTKSEEGHLTLMDDKGAIADGYEITKFVKTGRHFPEIAEVLEKMREDAT